VIQHTWSVGSVPAPNQDNRAAMIGSNVVAQVVATCTTCGEVRVSSVVVGVQRIDLAGQCQQTPG
jgi:hypothetical protein